MITSEEAFLRRKPNVSHLRIFGASIYFHLSNELRKKLESIIELGVFMGYTETPHKYGVYLTSIIMKVAQRDVKFDEDKAMKCSIGRKLQIPPEEDLLDPKEEP